MVLIYGPDTRPPKRPFKTKLGNRKRRYLAQTIGAIMQLPSDSIEFNDTWTFTLDEDVIHVGYEPDDGTGIRHLTIPYDVWDAFVRWYAKGWVG